MRHKFYIISVYRTTFPDIYSFCHTILWMEFELVFQPDYRTPNAVLLPLWPLWRRECKAVFTAVGDWVQVATWLFNECKVNFATMPATYYPPCSFEKTMRRWKLCLIVVRNVPLRLCSLFILTELLWFDEYFLYLEIIVQDEVILVTQCWSADGRRSMRIFTYVNQIPPGY